MNAGRNALPASIVEMPASRISFTSRSCNVPWARSTRPLAWGALAQMILGCVGADDVDVQLIERPTELGHAVAARRVLAVDPEHAVLVGVERHRLAVALQVGPRGFEVVEGRLGRHEAQVHETARRVVNEHQKRARRAAVLEPPMLGAVDLHELAHAVPAIARLVHGLEPLPPVAAEGVSPPSLSD